MILGKLCEFGGASRSGCQEIADRRTSHGRRGNGSPVIYAESVSLPSPGLSGPGGLPWVGRNEKTPTLKRLCFLSRGNWDEFRIPGRIIFQHGVESDDELSRGGGEYDFSLLATGFETLGKLSDASRFDAVMMNEIESGQVDRRANAGPSAEDRTLALILTAVTVEGCDADQGRDLLTIEFAELREFGEDGRTGSRTDTGNGLENFILTTPVVVVADEALDLVIEEVNLSLETIEYLVDALASGLGMTGAAAVGFHGSHSDQLPTAHDKLLKFEGFFRGFLERSRFDIVRESGQCSGINAIGLGDAADALGKMKRQTRIDDSDGETGVHEFGGQSSLKAARGLHDNEGKGKWFEMLEEGLDTGRVIRQIQTGLRGHEEDLEILLGDIDSHERLEGVVPTIHDRSPALPMRARRLRGVGRLKRLFGLTVRNRRRSSFRTASRAPRGYRSVVGRGCASFSATLRSSHTRSIVSTFVQLFSEHTRGFLVPTRSVGTRI